MLDLVLWSGALALAPLALGLACKLISGVTGPNGPAASMEVVSPNPDDIDIQQPAACRLAPAAAREAVPWSRAG
jgi:hypothetical protein